MANRFGKEARAEKARLLEACGALTLGEATTLVAYHDTLLFLIAFPEDRALLSAAEGELERVAAAARTLTSAPKRKKREPLAGTGIAWSQSAHAFTYPVARWLALEHTSSAELDDSVHPAPLQKSLQLTLPSIERDLLEDAFPSLDALFEHVKGPSTTSNLRWLVEQFDSLPCEERIREHLYESLELCVRFAPRGGPLSRTFARGIQTRPFLHAGGLARDFDLRALMRRPLPTTTALDASSAMLLVDAARGVLASLGRETDVIALAPPRGVKAFVLGRGFEIALYSMPPERRFVLDSHVGFMLFKNRVPLAYGGGWPFMGTCKIGVNVFEPFRGGESAYAFGEILRVYAQSFAVERFLVEPYQLGEGNREGLQSGAFWFYYRLGFRPIGRRHLELAASEAQRIAHEPGYRSPTDVMRRLSRADLELRLVRADAQPSWPNPALLAGAVAAWIAGEFSGDRSHAQRVAERRVTSALGIRSTQRWAQSERYALRALSPLLALIADLAQWPAREKRAAIALIRAKGAWDESAFARHAAGHRRLREALSAICSTL